ncbi:MAG TPA: YkgJ family cysteine cluster protein [Sphingomicrobium sp.]|nr:YkgJ family cysteine cluster protein [Sphingomicrobium sp.]
MSDVRRFACTLCGKCCNRSPEVELSEAAGLADMFVFRLMFRLYSLPRVPGRASPGGRELFYQKKRLLEAHSVRKSPIKLMRSGKAVDGLRYLMISAIAVDSRRGACAALSSGRCSIHDRRPLGCRTVPLHYTRPEGLALTDFEAFVAMPGHDCDTSEGAPPILEDGRIVDAEILQARADALELAKRDRSWKEAIVRKMKASRSGDDALPSLAEVEANSGWAALTSSMLVGWQIAAEAGFMTNEEVRALVQLQLERIGLELARSSSPAEDCQTLREMRVDYERTLI